MGLREEKIAREQIAFADTHPQLLKYWHPKNTIRPTQVTAGSHKKVWWICEKGHEWEAKIQTYTLMDSGCPYCAGRRAIPGETDLATLRPDMLKHWDYEKNTLSPSQVLPSAHDKVWWKCELGHSYQAVVYSRTGERAKGCPYCTGKKVLAGFNDLATRFPEVAAQWHDALNGDLKPRDVTAGSNKKVWWRCGDGHVWQACIYSRTRKKRSGCPVCAGMAKQTELHRSLSC